MVLAFIWMSFFVIAFLMALYKVLWLGDLEVFSRLVPAMFDAARNSVDIALGLVGVLTLWMGLFAIAEKAGLVQRLSRCLTPLFLRLMPQVPAGHPAVGSVTMNLSANVLGLDNAATPLGLQAMKDLQSLNATPAVASNAQILFLVLNASSVTLLPVTIFMYRAQQGASDPTSVFLPILLATSISTLVGLLSVAWMQRLPIWDRVALGWLGGFALLAGLGLSFLLSLPAQSLTRYSSFIGNAALMSVVVGFLLAGWRQKLDVFTIFVDGARQGFDTAIRLVPFLVAMIVAIGVFRACGAMDGLLFMSRWTIEAAGLNADFVPALPTALIKPLSGSGARGMMLETMQVYGVDSFPARVATVIQGSTETTFYVLTVYFGSVGIKHVRHALGCALLADFAGVVAAIGVSYWFFH